MRGATSSFRKFHQFEQIKRRFAKHGTVVASGSGTIISPDGLVLTASHVVKRGEKPKVLVGSEVLSAKVVKRLEKLDVLFLKITEPQSDFPYSDLISRKEFPLGMPVFSVGFPNPELQGYFPKFIASYISGSRGMLGIDSMVQFAADASSGCSGAGLFDENGRVVGMVSASLEPVAGDQHVSSDVAFATKSGSFYEAVKKHLPPVKNSTGLTRRDVIAAATRSSVTVLSTE